MTPGFALTSYAEAGMTDDERAEPHKARDQNLSALELQRTVINESLNREDAKNANEFSFLLILKEISGSANSKALRAAM